MSAPAGGPAGAPALPRWLLYSLLTIGAWGAWGVVSKIASDGVDANTNQILFTVGLIPLVAFVARSKSSDTATAAQRRSGSAWAFLTGILGGTGNIAFFHALVVGGQASVVVPVTALFPLVTVLLALVVLRERLSRPQVAGLALALVAIYLISMEP